MYVLFPALMLPCCCRTGVAPLTSMAYQRATSCVADTDTAWVATRVPLADADLRMRESMLFVITVPSGLRGGTIPEDAFTVRGVVVKVAELDSTLVILTTLMELTPPSETSHMGSPVTEPCMVVGRRLKPEKLFWKVRSEACGTPE